MKKTTIILIVSMIVVGLLWFIFFSRYAQERKIKAEIAKANYCEGASDCAMAASSKCPFGCYINVNKNEAERIENLLGGYESRYESRCAYLCLSFKGVECVNNTCQIAR